MSPAPGDQIPVRYKLDQLLERMGSREKAVREQAVQDACALSPADLSELFRLYRQHSKPRNLRLWMLILILFTVEMILLSIPIVIGPKEAILPYLVLIIFSPLVVLLIPDRKRRSLAQVLDTIDDPRLIGPMLRFVSRRETGDSRKMLISGWATAIRLLPQLRREHVADWTTAERKELINPLAVLAHFSPEMTDYCDKTWPNSFEFSLSLLKALEQVGDEREIEVVRKLAGMKAVTPKAKELQQAAQECLSYLSVRVEKQQQERMLLRATETPAAGQETLLRPASAQAVEVFAEQLLRPHDPGATS